MSVKPDQVIVYMGDDEKTHIREVSMRLGVSHSGLVRALSMPTIRKLRRALEQGADPVQLKKRLFG